MRRLEPLAQRLHVDFDTDARFDNPRAVQVRLPGFSQERLVEVGKKIRDLYRIGLDTAERIDGRVDDAYVEDLARAVIGKLGGKVGVSPRIFLKKLVEGVLDRVDQFEDFDPRKDYKLTIQSQELTRTEREAHATGPGGAAASADDVELDDS